MTANLKKIIVILPLIMSLFSCQNDNLSPEKINYKQEMRNFVEKISSYAKKTNPNFAIIPQNGINLISLTGEQNGLPDTNYIRAIDGIGQEDLYYGYEEDDSATAAMDTEYLNHFLKTAQNNGLLKIMITDYCSTPFKINNSYTQNNLQGYVSFAANHRNLDNIPPYPTPIYNENSENITKLKDVRNFLYLISPENEYSSKQEFIEALKQTNYDLILIDFFFDKEEFTKAQIAELKQKANGGKRLVISYLSIGEAEDYRYYWQADWKPGNPSFIESENPEWQGNYLVKYWDKKWQAIIFGSKNSYLDKIIATNFDGVYLDIIDAFERFE